VTEFERHSTIRTLVASFLFTDLVGYSKGTVAQQYAAKANLSAVLRRNLAVLHDADYKIKDTGDGALIAFVSNPEHALYMALAIAEDFGRAAGEAGIASDSLRTGLHLGSVKESTDMEARPNFVGDGINAAKRIMDFAAPGQITASRAFFDAVACLDSAYGGLFTHVGAPDDKHGRTHDLYRIAPSAIVLEKLRLELAEDAPERAPSSAIAAKGAATIDPKRGATSVVAADSQSRAGVSVRRVALVVVAVITLSIGTMFVYTKLTEPNAVKSPPATSETIVSPTTTKQADQLPVPPPSTKGPPVDAQTSSVVQSKPEAPASVDAARVGGDAPAADSAQPMTAPAPAATKTKTKPKTDASPAAPVPADVASDKNSPRCSRIMEKATLGETLTTEETKELASSCR
jgi:hypothetical protein